MVISFFLENKSTKRGQVENSDISFWEIDLLLDFFSRAQCGKTQNLLSLKKLFRQINSLAIYSLKTLFSRNFCQKAVRVTSCNFHTAVD